MSKIANVLSLVFIFALAAGCGIDETYTGLGEGALPGDPLNPIDPVAECPDCPSCNCNCGTGPVADVAPEVHGAMSVDDLAGFAWRFDSLAMTEPLTGDLGDGVNDYFSKEIEEGNLNVLLLVDKDDRETGELIMQIGAAEAKGAGYAFSADAGELVCNLAGQRFTTEEPSLLDFPNDLFTPPVLPIKHLKLTGILEADGSAIGEGELDGVLLEEDAKEITFMGQDFATFLETGMKIAKNADVDGDGTMDGWQFLFDFSAAQVEYTG